jgi:hypothetical protein
VDDTPRDALRILEEAREKWLPPPGPRVLTEEYLAAVERVEELPCNRPGTDKRWVHRLDEDTRRHYASARRTL